MFDQSGQEIWSAEREPFGTREINDDVDGQNSPVTLNVGFPGQYWDSESGLFYNYFRYYDPSLGRYLTSDSIGLDVGLNSYGYTMQSHIVYADPVGLKVAHAARGAFWTGECIGLALGLSVVYLTDKPIGVHIYDAVQRSSVSTSPSDSAISDKTDKVIPFPVTKQEDDIDCIQNSSGDDFRAREQAILLNNKNRLC